MLRSLWLMLLLAGACTTAHAKLLSSEQVSLTNEIDIFLDPSAQLRIEDVARPEFSKNFKRIPGEPNLGYITGTAWLRMTLTRPSNAHKLWWLELSSGLIDEAQLYQPNPNGGWIQHISGDMQPWTGRDVAYPVPVFKLEFPADQPVTLYLKLYSITTLNLHLKVWTTESFIASSNTHMLMFGFVTGIHFVLVLSNLWFFQATRNKTYLTFSIYTFINGICGLTADGLLYQYGLQDFPEINGKIQILSYFFTLPAGVIFFLQYLELFNQPRARWVTYVATSFWMIAIISGALTFGNEPRWLRPAYLIWILISMVLMCSLLIHLTWKGNSMAKLILLTLPFPLTGLALRLGNNIGLLESNFFSDHLIYLSSTMYVVIINYGISRRYKDMQKAKEEAQNLALKTSRDSNNQLEELVATRTKALKQALKLVESSLSTERQMHEEQRRFFSTVSHELRTPLAVIDATTKNLELNHQTMDNLTKQRYTKLQNATEQLAILIKNCFKEDRFEPLKHGPKRQAIDLNELLFDTYQAAIFQSQQHHIHIEADELPEDFICDPESTQLVLRTLVGNALKYTPPGTQVVLHGRYDSKGVTLEIIDNGPGVNTEDFSHLFEHYYRGKNSTLISGSGLGLPLARGLIEMQGGWLTIQSSMNQGFRATLWLPSNMQPKI